MKRLGYIWLGFALCLAVVLAAMAWISREALRLERVEAGAARQAAAEEKVRLALWRMESALSPLITRESARPYFVYAAFHPIGPAYTRMFSEIGPKEVLVPSPLLGYRSQEVLLHFQLDPAGKLTSPQVPVGNQRDLAETAYLKHEQIEEAARQLAELGQELGRDTLLAALPEVEEPSTSSFLRPARPAEGLLAAGNTQTPDLPRSIAQGPQARQEMLNTVEMNMRIQAQNEARVARDNREQVQPDVAESPLQALWAAGKLLLARRVRVGGKDYVQGCWLNWPQLRSRLLAGVRDLLPRAELAAADGGQADGQTYRLAALPVRLLPGRVPQEELPTYSSPLRMTLGIAWGCVLAGAVAVALLLRGAVVLGERRGAFVSAVTHELRTPLTTFRLYSDMLAEGMVADEAKRAGYLQRLREQADRLSHLVENVLAYARLSRGGGESRLETVALGDLVGRMSQRLAGRAEQAQIQLVIEGDSASQTRVRADVSAVEQILMNLIDNACKYARPPEVAGGKIGTQADRRIHLELSREGRRAQIGVRDHGRGISPAEARRLFKPFRKSASQAAHSAPGVGLGLALSRRLARQMGGDLRIDPSVSEGARFVLSLELAETGG